jgi:alginate O-acetyltransferase complex protein AlgI
MVFSSVFFLFVFLPVALALYYLLPTIRVKNAWLLLASLVFYSWGELRYLPLLLTSIVMNYLFGLLVGRTAKASKGRIAWVVVAVIANLALLLYFKYWTFLLTNASAIAKLFGRPIAVPQIALPLGISFFTFHALSYILDVARGQVQAQKSPFRLALYISLFPQLVAGPIIRYGHVADELMVRKHTLDDFAYGVYRFTIGLAKKVLIANVVGAVADACFKLPHQALTSVHACLGVVSYTLQIYFDFSGYSDMAIGLGRMFGFHFRENFDVPYVATSITDFWKRWHISLTSWFRDYLYVPLTGNQFWVPPWRSYSAMFVVFLLCGFWHGASWTFVAWGVLHGTMLIVERIALLRALERLPRLVRCLYSLLFVMAGWILFRSDSFSDAAGYFAAIFHLRDWKAASSMSLQGVINAEGWLALLVGVVGALRLQAKLPIRLVRRAPEGSPWTVSPVGLLTILSLLVVSLMKLASSSFNPFIYYRF